MESNVWRSMTAKALSNTISKEEIINWQTELAARFQKESLPRLKYQDISQQTISKLSALVGEALEFWRVIAQQRAVYLFQFYQCDHKSPLMKEADDDKLTNVEFGDDEAERSGKVWLVTRPALSKGADGQGRPLEKTIMFSDFKAHVMLDDRMTYGPQQIPSPSESTETTFKHRIAKEANQNRSRAADSAKIVDAVPENNMQPPFTDHHEGEADMHGVIPTVTESMLAEHTHEQRSQGHEITALAQLQDKGTEENEMSDKKPARAMPGALIL